MGIARSALDPDAVVQSHVASMRSYADALDDGWPLVARKLVVARIRKCAAEVERAYVMAKVRDSAAVAPSPMFSPDSLPISDSAPAPTPEA